MDLTGAIALQAISNLRPRSLTLKPGPVQEPVVLRTRRFAGEIQPAHVRPQVLVHFQTRAGRPVGVATVGPWLQAPTRVHECDWIRDVFGAEHTPQHVQDLSLCGRVVLILYHVALILHNGHENDA